MACQQVCVYVRERRRRKKREGLAIGDGRKRVNMPVKEGEGIKSKEEERDCTMHIDSITNLVALPSKIMPPTCTDTLLLFKIACTENQISLNPSEYSSVSYYVY